MHAQPSASHAELKSWLDVQFLTLSQAANLALGATPDHTDKVPNGYAAMLASMTQGVLLGGLSARVATINGIGGTALPQSFRSSVHNISDAFVTQAQVRDWLSREGKAAFFFDTPPEDWPAQRGWEVGAGIWPWGAHETDLLRKLAGAARRFWARYDPADPTTAPLNIDVETWLETQGVSSRTAQVMATILRADDVRSGPRKQPMDEH